MSEPLVSTAEDFTVRRGFWLKAGLLEPSPLFQTKNHLKEPEYVTGIDQTPLVLETPTTLGSDKKLPAPAQSPPMPGGEWRLNSTLGSLGPMNNGDFEEFPDDASLTRRFDQLADDNFRTIIVNGLLSRHTFPEDLPRITREIARYVKEAHSRGMKLIDHQDLTLLWQWGNANRVVAEWTPWLQTEVPTGLPNRGLNPLHPDFKKEFTERTLQLIRDTNIDGLMLDEVYFQDVQLSGDQYSRAKFKEDTGLDLPMDETNEDWDSMDSDHFRLWLAWRKQVLGDWWLEFREAVNEVKEDFTLMVYTTEFGFTSRFGSHRKGLDVTQVARGADFVGTESTVRNPFAVPGSVRTLRRIPWAIAQEFGHPSFALIYAATADIAYFGWALNNLNAQTTWWFAPPPKLDDFGYQFAENIDLNAAEQAGDVAVLYSIQSRDFSPVETYHAEPTGYSQQLDNHHIMHSMITDGTLLQGLDGVKTLVAANAACLSDEQVAAILEFVRSGGTLLASAEFAVANEFGVRREKWPLADVLGFSPKLPLQTASMELAIEGGTPVSGEVEFAMLTDMDPAHEGVILKGRKGGEEWPVAFAAALGEGRILYTPLRMGAGTWIPQRNPGDTMVELPGCWVTSVLEQLIKAACPEPGAFRPVSMPSGVITNMHRVASAEDETHVVHLLNATGGRVAPGATISALPAGDLWPKLSEDLVFEVKPRT